MGFHPMVSVCSNPACNTAFRYWHEGQVFSFRPDRGSVCRSVSYFWLCEDCVHDFVLKKSRGPLPALVHRPSCPIDVASEEGSETFQKEQETRATPVH